MYAGHLFGASDGNGCVTEIRNQCYYVSAIFFDSAPCRAYVPFQFGNHLVHEKAPTDSYIGLENIPLYFCI